MQKIAHGYIMAQLSRQKFDIFISDMLTGYMEKCDAASPRFILCSCSDCIQKYYRIVYINRTFVVYHLMPSFKVGGVEIYFQIVFLASLRLAYSVRYASSYLKLRNQCSIMMLSAQRLLLSIL